MTNGAMRIGFDRMIESAPPVIGTIARTPGYGTRHGAPIRIVRLPIACDTHAAAPRWSFDGTALTFDAPGVARYRCTPNAIAPLPPAPDTPSDMVEALLVATALPASLWLDGAFMLHASAVVPAGETVALVIAGRSGSGKSRLAAALLARGARLVADDSVAIRGDRCSGLAGGYHLGAPGEARAFHPVAHGCASARLGAILVLDDIAAPVRVRGVEAVAMLLAHRHRANAARHAGLEPRALADAARLARDVAICRWPRNDADALLDDAVRASVMGEDR